LAGRIADRQSLLDAGFEQVACINPQGLPLAEAMKPDVAKANIAATAMAAIT
jgi:glycerate kinase